MRHVRHRRTLRLTPQPSRAPHILRSLVQQAKLTATDAAAIVGNIGQESAYNPSAVGWGGDYGLCQWTAARKVRLFALARKLGVQPNTEDVQIRYLIWELHNTHAHALRALKQPGTLTQKTIRFCNTFEVPNPRYANYSNRIANANNALASYRRIYPS